MPFPSLVAPSLLAEKPSLLAEKQAVNELWSLATPPIIPSGTLLDLKIDAKGDYKVDGYNDYGQLLLNNKVRLFNVADQIYRDKGKNPYSGENAQRKAVMMAIAMRETNDMDLRKRDTSKDHTPAANNTIFNLNYDMLNFLTGYSSNDYGLELNKDNDATLKLAMDLLDQCFDKQGIKRILDFHRGGRTGFDHPVSCDASNTCNCYVYRNAVLTTYNIFNQNPSLLNDSMRVEMYVPYCR